MVDNRSAGFYGIGGAFNFKSGDPSGTAAKMSQDKYGSEAMYLPPAEGEEEAEITFECVEDETLGNELLAIFQELADAEAEEGDGIEIETEDDDDEEAEDEDDSKWDQFIHKKLDD